MGHERQELRIDRDECAPRDAAQRLVVRENDACRRENRGHHSAGNHGEADHERPEPRAARGIERERFQREWRQLREQCFVDSLHEPWAGQRQAGIHTRECGSGLQKGTHIGGIDRAASNDDLVRQRGACVCDGPHSLLGFAGDPDTVGRFGFRKIRKSRRHDDEDHFWNTARILPMSDPPLGRTMPSA